MSKVVVVLISVVFILKTKTRSFPLDVDFLFIIGCRADFKDGT